MERVILHARQKGCFFEINSSPDRPREFGLVRYGIDQARRAGLEKVGNLPHGLFVGGRTFRYCRMLSGDELGGFSRERGEADSLQVRFHAGEGGGVLRWADQHSKNIVSRAIGKFRRKSLSVQHLYKNPCHATVHGRYLKVGVAWSVLFGTRNDRYRRHWLNLGRRWRNWRRWLTLR